FININLQKEKATSNLFPIFKRQKTFGNNFELKRFPSIDNTLQKITISFSLVFHQRPLWHCHQLPGSDGQALDGRSEPKRGAILRRRPLASLPIPRLPSSVSQQTGSPKGDAHQ